MSGDGKYHEDGEIASDADERKGDGGETTVIVALDKDSNTDANGRSSNSSYKIKLVA